MVSSATISTGSALLGFSIATGCSAVLGSVLPLAIQEYASGYSKRSVAVGAFTRIGRSAFFFHIYIESALAGPFAQEQRLSFHSICALLPFGTQDSNSF